MKTEIHLMSLCYGARPVSPTELTPGGVLRHRTPRTEQGVHVRALIWPDSV